MGEWFLSDDMLREFERLEFASATPVSSHFDGYSDADLLIACVREPEFQRVSHRPSVPSMNSTAPLAEQVAACLEILLCQPYEVETIYGAGAPAAAQQRLSRLLVAHPVLLHPCLRVHMTLIAAGGKDEGSCSLAHAIALTRHGRFPMARDGFSQSELSAFANHPCVRMGLTFRHPSFVAQASSGGLCGISRKTALQAGLARSNERPGLIVSLRHLYDHLEAVNKACNRPAAQMLVRSLPETTRRGILPKVFAFSFMQAMGVAGPEALEYPEFVAMIAGEDSTLRHAALEILGVIMHPTIFGGTATPAGGQVEDRVQRVVRGLVGGGFEGTERGAALWLRANLTRGFPFATVPQALEYVRAMESFGADDTLTFVESSDMEYAREQTHASAWLAAARAHAMETDMTKVIAQVDPQPLRRPTGRPRALL